MTGDEVRLTVDIGGMAHVEHAILWHVVAGQYHFLDVVGVDATMTPDIHATVTAEDGRAFAATLVPKDNAALRVLFDEPKGIRHGRYKIRFSYDVDLVRSHAFVRDGAMWRLTWQGPSFPDGYDGAKVTFGLPASADEPRVDTDGTRATRSASDDDTGVVATLRRSADRDELDLVKPHVARREVVSWSLRVSPRAFPALRDPSLRPPPSPVLKRRSAPGLPPLVLFGGALAAAFAYAWLVYRKGAAFERSACGFASQPHPTLDLRVDHRAAGAGAAFGAGVLCELAGAPLGGGGCMAAAMFLAVIRAPRVRLTVRGPGKWLALRPAEAFDARAQRAAGDWFDPLCLRGACVTALCVVLLVGLGWALGRISPQAPYFVALDAVALLPIVATGRATQLPPVAFSSARWLSKLYRPLAKHSTVRAAPWVRVPSGSAEPDELRILVVPRAPMPGLVGIEVGRTCFQSPTSFVSLPGVLVRVHGVSAASARMTMIAPFARPVPGRTPEEKVYRLSPRLPTRSFTLALVRRLARELEDRRSETSTQWSAAERRKPPCAAPGAVAA